MIVSRCWPADMHLFAGFVTRAQGTPDRPFCHLLRAGAEETVSYGAMYAEAAALAASLTARGIRPGQIVPIVLEHRRELFSSFIGCSLAGAVPAFLPPLTRKQDPDVFRASVAALLARIDPTLVIGSAATLASLDLAGRAGLDIDAPRPAAANPTPLRADDADLAFLQHSSGTTGLKKGVCLTHGAVLRQVHAYAGAIAATDADIVVSWLPLYHDMGLITSFIMPVVLGLPIVCLDPLEWVIRPTTLLDAIERHRATLCWQPNFAFHHIVRLAAPDQQWNLASLRLLVSCSEPCRTQAFTGFAERFAASNLPPTALATSYAMAENVFAVTQTLPGMQPRPGTGAAAGFLSSGVPLHGTALRLFDPSGAPVADGELGEIHIHGDCLFNGYHHQPELTAQRISDGWYATGDIAIQDGGDLFVIGRTDDVLNINGRKLVAHELEDALNGVPGIAPGRVIVFADHAEAQGATELAVAAEPATDAPPGSEAASTIRRAVLAQTGLRPSRVVFVPRGFLLKSTSGKISRAASLAKLRAHGYA